MEKSPQCSPNLLQVKKILPSFLLLIFGLVVPIGLTPIKRPAQFSGNSTLGQSVVCTYLSWTVSCRWSGKGARTLGQQVKTQAWGGAEPNGPLDRAACPGWESECRASLSLCPSASHPTGIDCPALDVHQKGLRPLQLCLWLSLKLLRRAPELPCWLWEPPSLCPGLSCPQKGHTDILCPSRLSWHGGGARLRAALTHSQEWHCRVAHSYDVCGPGNRLCRDFIGR